MKMDHPHSCYIFNLSANFPYFFPLAEGPIFTTKQNNAININD